MRNLVLCASVVCLLSGIGFALEPDYALWLHGADSWNIAFQSTNYWNRANNIVLQFEVWGGEDDLSQTESGDWPWPDCGDGVCDKGVGLWAGFWNGPMPQTLDPLPCDGDIGNLGCEDADYNFDFIFCPVWGWDWADGAGGIGREGQYLNEDPEDCPSSGSTGQFGEGSDIINAFVNSSKDNRLLIQLVAGTSSGANLRYSMDGGRTWIDEPNSQYADCSGFPASATEISIGFVGFGNNLTGGVYIDNVVVWSGGAGGTVEMSDDFSNGFTSDWNVVDRGDGSIQIHLVGYAPSGTAGNTVVHHIPNDQWVLGMQTKQTWNRGNNLTLRFKAWPAEDLGSGPWPDGVGLLAAFYHGTMPPLQYPLGDLKFGDSMGESQDRYNWEFGICTSVGWDFPGSIGLSVHNLNDDGARPACGAQDGNFDDLGNAFIQALMAADEENPLTIQFVLGNTAGGNLSYSTDGVTFTPEPDCQYADCSGLPAENAEGLSVGFIGFGNPDSGGIYIDDVEVWQNGVRVFSDGFHATDFLDNWNVLSTLASSDTDFGLILLEQSAEPVTGVSSGWEDYR